MIALSILEQRQMGIRADILCSRRRWSRDRTSDDVETGTAVNECSVHSKAGRAYTMHVDIRQLRSGLRAESVDSSGFQRAAMISLAPLM